MFKLKKVDATDVFGVGQRVLVRDGNSWHEDEIDGITVIRHDVYCSHCGMPLKGEPRFWFKGGEGNISLNDIMIEADICTS